MKNQLNYICESVSTIVKHHNQLTKARGEDFNVFSILKMERKENDTHSAFLGALLNPEGTHYLGDKFLQLFIGMILELIPNQEANIKLLAFNSKTAKLNIEVGIGNTTFCNHNDVILKKCSIPCTCSGGRIDIYLKDALSNTISIENKIDAYDQNSQVKRYYNHNTNKNTVIYLTKAGVNPSKASKRDLVEGEHFFNISYKTHIVNWLENCLKETVNQPILRETIKQYIILIKKITNTMTNQEEQDLQEVFFKDDNLKAAKVIADNYETILNKIRDKFKKEVLILLKPRLLELGLTIKEGNTNYNHITQLLIRPIVNHNSKQFYAIESFSKNGHFGGKLFVGVFDEGKTGLPTIDNSFEFNELWSVVRYVYINENEKFNLSELDILKLIYKDQAESTNIQSTKVAEQILQFIEETLNTHVVTK